MARNRDRIPGSFGSLSGVHGFPETFLRIWVLCFSSSCRVWQSYQVPFPCWPQWVPLNDLNRSIGSRLYAYRAKSRLHMPRCSLSISPHLLFYHVSLVRFFFFFAALLLLYFLCFGAWILSEWERPSVLHRTTTYQRHSRQQGRWLRGMTFIVFSFQLCVFCPNIVKRNTTYWRAWGCSCGLRTVINNTHLHVFYRPMNLITVLFYFGLLFPGNHRRSSDGFNWRWVLSLMISVFTVTSQQRL